MSATQPPRNLSSYDVVILGAGYAGLMAAVRLGRPKWRLRVALVIVAKVSDFGLRDLRAKGATDEYRAGRPIRELQNLLGHKSVRTTEIYLKELIPETVRPNERPMIAGSK